MEFLLGLLLFTSVQLAATMSPGPAFVVAVRNSMGYGRKVGIFTAVGLSLGVLAHVFFVLIGISYLIAKSVLLFSFIKYAGAVYLIYIGVKALRSGKAGSSIGGDVPVENLNMGISKAIYMGFLTNLLNPKAVIFFTAIFTQFISVSTPFYVLLSYGMISVSVELLWFAAMAMVLGNNLVKDRCKSVMNKVERLCGGLMVALGLKLALLK